MNIETENIEKIVTIDNVEQDVKIDAKNAGPITVIVDKTKQKTLDELTLNDFSKILDEFPQHIQNILKPFSSSINAKVTPKEIYEEYQKHLFTPTDSSNEITSVQLWEGWLLFLIYVHLSNPAVSLGNYSISIDNQKMEIEFLYNKSNKNFSNLIHDLLASTKYKAKKSNIFIFNNSRGMSFPNILPNEEKERIIVDFTTVNGLADEVFGKRKSAYLHLSALTNNVSSCIERDLSALKVEIKTKIMEVLQNALS